MTYRTPPPGWFTMGTHIDDTGPLEFSKECDEAGMPFWERPVCAHGKPLVSAPGVSNWCEDCYKTGGLVR